jgi:glycosyltransferase involved in cell wall biosynthesis
MFTVVIPLYNKEKFISETIQAVLQQTFKNFEILLVNDGSTDNSLQKIAAFSDNRIKVISQKNKGVSAARNTAIQAASTTWIAFLDADDIWQPTFLEEIAHAIKEYPTNKIFATGRSLLFKDGLNRYDNPYLPPDGKTEIINYYKVISRYLPLVNSSNSVIHKSLFEEKGYFNIAQKKHEDHDLWMRLCINQQVVFINKNLSIYRKTETDAASKLIYEATDFKIFINTIKEIDQALNPQEKQYFKEYYNKFLVLTYIKNKHHYTLAERKTLFKNIKKLVTGKYAFLLNIISLIPIKNSYKILKTIKK